jgi:hypothetical protein
VASFASTRTRGFTGRSTATSCCCPVAPAGLEFTHAPDPWSAIHLGATAPSLVSCRIRWPTCPTGSPPSVPEAAYHSPPTRNAFRSVPGFAGKFAMNSQLPVPVAIPTWSTPSDTSDCGVPGSV